MQMIKVKVEEVKPYDALFSGFATSLQLSKTFLNRELKS